MMTQALKCLPLVACVSVMAFGQQPAPATPAGIIPPGKASTVPTFTS